MIRKKFFHAIIFAVVFVAVVAAVRPLADISGLEAIFLVLIAFGLLGLVHELKKFE